MKAKKYHDRGAKPLTSLQTRDNIRVRMGKTWKPARLLPDQSRTLLPRSYQIQLPSGKCTWRNRRDILQTQEPDIYHSLEKPDLEIEMPNGPRPPGLVEEECSDSRSVVRAPSTSTHPHIDPIINPPLELPLPNTLHMTSKMTTCM